MGDKQAFSINHKCFLVDPKLVLQNNDKTSAFDTLSKNSVIFQSAVPVLMRWAGGKDLPIIAYSFTLMASFFANRKNRISCK